MKNINTYCNYALLDPRKPIPWKVKDIDLIFRYEPFYIGKGKDNRHKEHLNKSSLKRNYFKDRIIKKLLKENLVPIIIVINDNISEKEAHENKKFLIRMIGRRDLKLGPLTNLTDGREGTSGWIPSEETRKKFKNRPKRSHPHTAESKKKISEANKGKVRSKELRKQISEKLKKDPTIRIRNSKAAKSHALQTGIPVIQYDLFFNIIKEFANMSEASRSSGVNMGTIKRMATKKDNHVAGRKNSQSTLYKWRFKNEGK